MCVLSFSLGAGGQLQVTFFLWRYSCFHLDSGYQTGKQRSSLSREEYDISPLVDFPARRFPSPNFEKRSAVSK